MKIVCRWQLEPPDFQEDSSSSYCLPFLCCFRSHAFCYEKRHLDPVILQFSPTQFEIYSDIWLAIRSCEILARPTYYLLRSKQRSHNECRTAVTS